MSHDMMPSLREAAKDHPDLWVMDDGSIQLRPGATEAYLDGTEGHPDGSD